MSIFSHIYMADKTATRSFPFLWYIRLGQVVISFLVLILSAVDAHTVQNLAEGCSVPSKIAYNLACAVLALFVLAYFIFSTGPRNPFRSLPWLLWGQLALDGLMWIFWVAAAANSSFTYLDLCDACPQSEFYGCSIDTLDDFNRVRARNVSPFPQGLAGVEKRAAAVHRSRGTTAVGRAALDSIMTVSFSICIGATIRWMIIQRRSSGTPAPTMKLPGHPESGLPMNSTAPVASNPPMQPNQYFVSQGQPQQPQHVYHQSAPHTQYPVQPQQDLVYQQ